MNRQRGSDGPPTSPSEYRSRLRAAGGAVLVTGTVDMAAQSTVSRWLFNADQPGIATDSSPVQRLLVLPDASVDPKVYLPAGVDPTDESVEIIAGPLGGQTDGGVARSATAETDELHPDSSSSLGAQIVDEISELARTVERTCDNLVDAADAEASSLRIGVGSLLDLLRTYDVTTVIDFCRLIAGQMEHQTGLAHVHYPRPDLTHRTYKLALPFDARVEIRPSDESGRPEAYWHTPHPALEPQIDWQLIDEYT